MIKTTNGVISSQMLTMTLQKIGQAPVASNIAYRIKKLLDAVNIKMKKISEDYKTVIGKKYGELDEKGEIIPENNPNGFKMKEGADMEAMLKDLEDFSKLPIEIDRWPLTLRDLADVKMSAAEVSALDCFLADPEAEETKITSIA